MAVARNDAVDIHLHRQRGHLRSIVTVNRPTDIFDAYEMINDEAMCYQISLHTNIEPAMEVFRKEKDQQLSLESRKQGRVLSFRFPEFLISYWRGADAILTKRSGRGSGLGKRRCDAIKEMDEVG